MCIQCVHVCHVFVCDGMRLQVRIVSIIKSMYGEKNCENMSSHRRVARESVLVVLAFSMICFEWNAFFAREGLGYIGARDMYIDVRFNSCVRYIIPYKRYLKPIYMGVGKRCAHRRATRRDETPSADARAVREETRGAGGCRGRCGPRRRPRARSRRENSRIHSFIHSFIRARRDRP